MSWLLVVMLVGCGSDAAVEWPLAGDWRIAIGARRGVMRLAEPPQGDATYVGRFTLDGAMGAAVSHGRACDLSLSFDGGATMTALGECSATTWLGAVVGTSETFTGSR